MVGNMDKNNLNNIDLTHCYFDNILLKEVEKYQKDFLNYKSIDLCKTLPGSLTSHVLFIEIQTLNKENFKILNNLVKNNISKEIYIFSSIVILLCFAKKIFRIIIKK